MVGNSLDSPALPSRETAALVESVKDYAILTLDPEGHVVSWNDGARLIKGWSAEEILGHSFSRFYAPDDLASRKPWRLLEEAATHGRVEDEGWRVRKDGTRFWADVVITALRNEADGSLRGFVKVVRDLTERRAAEQKLRESEQRVRLLVESVKDYAIFMLDPNGRIESWNSGAQRIKGWQASEVIGRTMSIFYPDGGSSGRPAELLRIAASTGRVEEEGWRVRKDGTRFWADVVISRVEADDGRLLGFSKVTRDLTERRESEHALRQSEERTRLMIASVRDYAIFMLDPNGYIATWNPGAERCKGYTEAQAIGQHFEMFYPAEDRQVGKPRRELEIAEREGRYEEEGWRVRRDGTRMWANVVISAVRDAAGTLVGFTKVTRDQTEQRRAARRLEANARQKAAMAALGIAALRDRSPDGVAERVVRAVRELLDAELVTVWTRDGDVLKTVAEVGWREGTNGEVASPDPASLVGRAYLRREPVIVSDITQSELLAPTSIEREHGARSGAAVVIPAPSPAAPPYGVLVAMRLQPDAIGTEDVSFLQGVANVIAASITRREDEEQLRLAELAAAEQRSRSEQAQRELKERDEFISIASHELRTPLNALQLNLHALARALGEHVSERAQTRIDGALRQTKRLSHLIERLLDVSRIASGSIDLVPEHVDLAGLARDVVDSLRETAARAGSEVTLEAQGEASGEWDRTRIEQITTNLLANAIHYGSGKPIEVRIEADDDRAKLTVIDHGIGIAPADVERIFGRFERAAPVRNYGGLGLGLYVAQHIIDAHGGAIRVESAPGVGSRFMVELPRSGAPRTQLTGSKTS